MGIVNQDLTFNSSLKKDEMVGDRFRIFCLILKWVGVLVVKLFWIGKAIIHFESAEKAMNDRSSCKHFRGT